MDITPYVDDMTTGLRIALAAHTEPQQADQLAAAVQAPARLALMGAVSQAAAEASDTLPNGRIGVQLAGPNLVLAFEPGPVADEPPTPVEPSEPDDTDQARLTLRLPAYVKAQAEKAAAEQGVSLNTWVVAALRDATSPDHFNVRIGPSNIRFSRGNQRFQGWI